jgi:hypothetical protein
LSSPKVTPRRVLKTIRAAIVVCEANEDDEILASEHDEEVSSVTTDPKGE